MKKTRFSTCMAAGVLALSVLLPVATTFAQTAPPPPETRPPNIRHETRDEGDNTGLWGLLGLTGLVGLAGLRRRPETVRTSTDPRERNKV